MHWHGSKHLIVGSNNGRDFAARLDLALWPTIIDRSTAR
jgi:hypothetical protein